MTKDGEPAELAVEGLTPEQSDAIVDAVNQMGNALVSMGLGHNALIGAFGCGLAATVLQGAGLDHTDSANGAALLAAFDRAIDETIPMLRARTQEQP